MTAPFIANRADVEEPCGYCERTFRRVHGIHIGSQRLGMIPSEPCTRVAAVEQPSISNNKKPWLAFVDGEALRDRHGEVKRYTTAAHAYRAACKAAPKRWHA